MNKEVTQAIELIIFDWDGTLIDSEANIVSCMTAMMDDLNLPRKQEQEIRNIIGLGMREALQTLFPDAAEPDYTDMISSYRNHFFGSEPSKAFPGSEQVLDRLHKSEYFLAVATGKGRQGLEKALDHTGFRRYFHASRCADETRSKPHPQMLEELLEYTGLEPNQALMVGDTQWDLEMANAIKMPAIGVSYGVHEKDRLHACKPLSVIDNITELLRWLDGGKLAIGNT